MAEKSKRQAPAPIVPDETSELLRFGSSLFESFSASPVSKPDVKEIQLARFGDYMHHFGFTLERDVPKRSIVASTLPQNVPTGTQRMRNAEHIHAPADGDDTVEEAGWGMPAAITEEADARCTAAGSFEGCKRFADIATALTAPFEHVTWRQTAEDCALKKVRCIYSWLCQHVTIALERPAPPEDKTKAAPPAKGSDRRSKTGRLKSTAQVVVENEVPPDPLEVALETRTATPVLIATLYQQMLAHVGIDSLLVDGLLKGLSAEEPVEWWWNMVVVGGRSYLVDIASSTYKGVLRQVAEVVVGADTPNDGRGNKLGAAAAKKEKEKEKKPKKDAVKEPETTPAVPLVNLSLGKGPTILQTRRPVEDFYFCTHPSQFIFTHFPRLLSHTLLVAPPNNVSWDSAPRLTHDFFKFPVQLKSHKRSAVFSVRSTPFYISLINQEPSTTELCCVLYQCTLRELPEDLSEKSPLGPEWVWHQRQESTMTETFTLMVPDAGFYCAVIGARQIRPDPYSASISTESFLPILYYQAKTNFVPVSTSLVPRQHLSPSICRLFSPLTAQVMPGTHPVVVVPTCSNVVAVAVVRKTKQAVPDADVAAGEANAKEVRELDSFLAFAPKEATYNGNVSVRTGDGIELWVLYAAPHRNGVSFHEMITIKEKERPPTPPPPVQPNSKTKRKTIVPVGPSPEELEKDKLHRQLAHGQSFIPFVTGIEVRKFVSKDAAGVIQPQPSAEEERAATLRRLIGVTGELYTEATNAATRSGGAVGTYFYKREKFIFNEVASPA